MLQQRTDARKRRSREWDPRTMNTEVFETPEPEVTFQAYASVHSNALASRAAPEDTHGFDKAIMELDEAAVQPNHAFEVFMGKVYKPTPLLPKLTEFESTGGAASVSKRASNVASKNDELESPLQRFTRLAMELKELESDLTLLATNADASRSDANAVVVVDAAQDAEYSEIMHGLSTLQLSLTTMEQTPRFQPFLQPARVPADAVATLQRDLTTKFFQQIDALKKSQLPSHGCDASASTSAAPIVYEIYSNGELNAVDRDAKTRLLALESKLAMLEKLIGATNPKELHVDGLRASASASADLSSLVDELDKHVGLLSEKNLDAIKTRTTALVHELTLLNKLKDSSSSVQSALATQADKDKIQQIYEQLAQVQDVAASVPALVDRLVTLKSVHDESLDLSSRVQKIEQSQDMLQQLLESDASMLTNIETSLQDNMQIFQANIQTLDERMNRLLGGGR